MPRKKGYGIPPTKRIKIENGIENNENELQDVTYGNNASVDMQKPKIENCVKDSPTSSSDGFSNVSTTNGTKYLHKKFKKMAAILSDDCVTSSETDPEKPVHISVTQASSPVASTVFQQNVSTVATPQSSLPQCAAAEKPPPDVRVVPHVTNNSFTISQSCFTAPTIATTTAFPSAYCTSRSSNATAVLLTTVPNAVSSDGDSNVAAASTGRHMCPYCKLVCNKPSVLQKHIRAHTNERPFPCHPCGFAFKTRSNLYKHRRSRSHSLKLEEVGTDGKSYGFDDDIVCEEDEDSLMSRDIDSGNDDGKVEHPKTSIYKPKFHKAAIYIQNIATSSVSSNADSSTVATTTTPTTSATITGLNKFGLQLVIPSTVPSSNRLTPSPFSGSSPSPEFLQRHINKLINENQAIVETTDPFWSKKFCQRSKEGSSLPSSPLPLTAITVCASVEGSMPKKRANADNVEERLLPVESKLAHALLQPKIAKSSNANEAIVDEPQPLNLSISRDVGKSKVQEVMNESIMNDDVKPKVTLMNPVKIEVAETKPNVQALNNIKFVRPTSLPLKPGTFIPKKMLPGSVSALPLVSPETPRPNKSYGQLYIGGNAYTYLGLKCSTRSTFCTLHKSQPTYVPLSPEHNKISMYSNWKVRSEVDPYLRNVPPTKAMSCYDSRQRYSQYTVVHGKIKDAVTHSSYWFNRSKKPTESGESRLNHDDENKENNVQMADMLEKTEDASRLFKLGIGKVESNENYTYIRGRGRGKYVCSVCGIRCRKPSMLKKHIRTHTDVRPYTCKHCVFSFKTKGNLTKHMKTKAHYKKCIELEIVPVPTIVDDSYIDEEVLSKQELQLEDGQDNEETEDEDEDDDDEDEDDNEDDYGDDDPRAQLEAAKSLLSLSKMSHQTFSEQYANAGLVSLNARPNTYPYNFSVSPHVSSKPNTPTLMFISEQKERETVSKNTGLARELQPPSNTNQTTKQKGESHVGRYYFGSAADKEVTTASDLRESTAKDSTVTSVFPIDLSISTPDKKISWSSTPLAFDTVSHATTTSVCEILTPVSEPILLANICSNVNRLQAAPVNNVTDSTEGSIMLQTYLKEKAVKDLKIKQQYQSPHIKIDQREFDMKYNAYNEAFQIGAAEKLEDPRTTPSPKRKIHCVYENNVEKKSLTKFDRCRVGDVDSKENFALTGDSEKNGVIMLGSPNSGPNNSPKRVKPGFILPCNGPLLKYASVLEDGRSKCVVCDKVFSKPSLFGNHVKIHYFESPYRCDECVVSFRTKGQLEKHKASNAHSNKVRMNATAGGQTSTNDQRPFKCNDCSVGFRIHGHLAKHLRCKMHIMKLECLGKLPFGTYAEMERCGVNLNDIDTTDCENSLESLQRIAKIVGSVMFVNNADDEGRITANASPY